MDRWNDIADELIRMRQEWSCPRDIRKLGKADFGLRPILADAVRRYTSGRCMDFAVRMAVEYPDFRLVGFHAGSNLIHGFLLLDAPSTAGGTCCIEVSGVWTLPEMKRLHAADGKFTLRHLDLERTIADMEANEANGADFDGRDIVLSVSGCLPHLREFVPAEFRAESADEALSRLKAISESRFTEGSVDRPRDTPLPKFP
jgi:hypothetical protein